MVCFFQELNSSSKDEGGNDAETTTPKETVCTKVCKVNSW